MQSFSVRPLSSKLGFCRIEKLCGERGIRTPETLLEFTRFPGVPLQPLEHLSFVGMRLSHERRLAASLGRPRFLLLTRAHEALVTFIAVNDRLGLIVSMYNLQMG